MYDVKVLSDKAESVIATVLSAIASPPHASYVVRIKVGVLFILESVNFYVYSC